MVIAQVEWICSKHTDADNDGICDDCREYFFLNTTIVNYNAQTKEATVFVTNPDRYSLIFADYENDQLANVYIVEYDFIEGINIIPQRIANFTFVSVDKVMLWYDLVPVCGALTIK